MTTPWSPWSIRAHGAMPRGEAPERGAIRRRRRGPACRGEFATRRRAAFEETEVFAARSRDPRGLPAGRRISADYDALRLGSESGSPLHQVAVMGANHNFFNTVWTPGIFPPASFDDAIKSQDLQSTDCHCGVNSGRRLNRADQRAVGAAYLTARSPADRPSAWTSSSTAGRRSG